MGKPIEPGERMQIFEQTTNNNGRCARRLYFIFTITLHLLQELFRLPGTFIYGVKLWRSQRFT